jgi:hypothetical protein
MRKIHQLRNVESKRTRKRFGLSAAIFGIASAAVVFGTISSGILSADSAPHATSQTHAPATHAAVTHAAVTHAPHTTAETELETSSPYSGGHQMTADPTGGYWTVSWLGAVTAHDGAPTFGSPAASGTKLAKPIIGMAATPDGQGYWLVASDGGIFAYGDAQFYGSTGATHLNAPIVGMATTPDGKGYWLVATDGGIFTFGDAAFYGSTGALHLNQPVVGMSATPDGNGYWLVASDGGIFTFGDAAFYGSTGAIHLNEPIVGMAPTEDGKGYWLVASDGGIFTYGDAGFIGSLGGTGDPVIGILVNPAAVGYTLVEANGTAVVPTLAPVAAPLVSVPSTGTSSPPKTTSPAPTVPAAPTSTTTPSISSGTLLEGSYDGAADPGNIAAFDAATGTHSEIASDYLPTNSGWTGMDGAGGSLAWLTNPWQGSGYTLSLGVPIIPTNSSGVAQGTLAAGATGAYNSYFVTLAQTLVAAGEGNAYLRLGWEFDGNWYPSWDADTPAAEAQFAAYFDQIVTAMRTVAGEKFQFVWNPDVGAFIQSGYNVALAYPGNAYVNDIGLDAYDETWVTPQTPTNAWNETTQPALTAARAFAAAQGKPIVICEWGIAFLSNGHGLGDDPLYINDFAAWMKDPANNVAYESYFNFDGTSDSVLTGGTTPNSLAAFKADFG